MIQEVLAFVPCSSPFWLRLSIRRPRVVLILNSHACVAAQAHIEAGPSQSTEHVYLRYFQSMSHSRFQAVL